MGNFQRGGRPNFQKKSWGDKGGDRGEVVMHKAVCAECGNGCEVPFRPTPGKQVFCRECFASKGGGRDERAPRREFNDRPAVRPSFENNRGNDDTKRLLESLNSKFDRLIAVIEAATRTAHIAVPHKEDAAPVLAEKKSVKKTPAKKKK